jgi:hypothetical protein
MSLVGQLASRCLFSERCEDIGLDPDGDHLFGDAADGWAADAPGAAEFSLGELRDVRKVDITIWWLGGRAVSCTTGARGGSRAAR